MTLDETTTFRGVTLITGELARPQIADANLVVQGERIVATGPSAELPAQGHVVELSGKFIMPAIINPHVHIGYMRAGVADAGNYSRDNILEHLQRFAYHGVSVVQSLGTDRDDTEIKIRDEQRAGLLDAPELATLFTAGTGLVAPTPNSTNGGAHFATDVLNEVTEASDARDVVRTLAAKRVDVVKFWLDSRNGTKNKMSPPVYRAIIDQAHDEGLKVIAHIHDLDDAKAVIRAGVDGTAHLVREPGPDPELIDLALDRDVFMFTSLGIQRAATMGPSHLDDELLAETVSASVRSMHRTQLINASPDMVRYLNGVYEVVKREVGELTAAGLRLVLSGDTGLFTQFPGFAEHFELESMVDAGMSPVQAINAGTAQSARVLGIDANQGTLTVGKRADFIVLSANPLENITNTRRITDVYLRGSRLDRQAMRGGWSD